MKTQPSASLDRALDEALAEQGGPAVSPSSSTTGDSAEVSALVSLAGDLARLPKAPGPTADFTRALAVRLAQASGGAQPDPTLAERLDAALLLHAAPLAAPPTAVPAELAELLVLADGLRRLPAAPAPSTAFRAALAARLTALPGPVTETRQAAVTAPPTQDLLQVLDQSLDALVAGHGDPRAFLLAACEHDAQTAGELASLLDLAAGLRSLPAVPSPVAAFRIRVAKALRQAPWPRSLPRHAPAAPWSWLAALWRNTAAMATAAATLLLFLGRDHLPSMAGSALDAADRSAAVRRAADQPAAEVVPIHRIEDRSADLRRPDGWLRVSLPRPAQSAPLVIVARIQPERAAPAPAERPPAAAASQRVAYGQPVAEAPAPEPAAASDDENEDRDRDRDRAVREASHPAPGAAPTEAPQPLPTQAPPSQPAPTEPPAPQPTAAPLPTAPVIPANEPPRILGLTCTPDQVEEAGSAECRVEVEDDGGLPGLSFEWLLQGVGPELSDPRAPTVTFTASGNGGGLGWQGEFILVIIVRDAQGLETQGRTQVTITPAQP